MRRTRVIIAFVALCSLQHVFAQDVTGTVIDSDTHGNLAFVNVGIIGKNIGTVTDSTGRFTLSLATANETDTLRLSLVGYKPKDLLVSEIKSKTVLTPISLTPQTIMLREIDVVSTALSRVVLGTKPESKLVNVGFIYNNLGHEIGSVFRNSREMIIDSIRLNIAKCKYPRLYLRLNIYTMIDGRIETIQRKPYYISITEKEALNHPTFDMSQHNVVVDSDFVVSVEIVRDLGEKGLYFYANLNDRKTPAIYRATSHANWIYMQHKSKPVGISIQVYGH